MSLHGTGLAELSTAKSAAAEQFLNTTEAPLAFAATEAPRAFIAFAASAKPERNVVGVGMGPKLIEDRNTGEQCIRFYVKHKIRKAAIAQAFLLPDRFKGFKTDVIESGRFYAYPPASAASARSGGAGQERMRPAMPGCSVGFQFTGNEADSLMAGTFGAVVTAGGLLYILSNNHVLADENRLPVGSPIFQPGLLDQGDSTLDQIAKLARLIPLAQRATNTVDCAIAEVLDRDSVNPAVYEIGPLASDQPIPAEVEMGVQKMGRTTHRTTGSVFDTSADLLVEYRMGQLKFQNQILIRDNNGNFCRQGDSGALIIDQQTKRATALLFGASNEFTIANHLTEVLKALEVGLVS